MKPTRGGCFLCLECLWLNLTTGRCDFATEICGHGEPGRSRMVAGRAYATPAPLHWETESVLEDLEERLAARAFQLPDWVMDEIAGVVDVTITGIYAGIYEN